ncbi:hypothetical protein [Ilumatobacter sp.]|uniref:hypothetical protein n=1 Tax=Ilumatobacter sp. TaxID=1967498 RepID=UPI003C4905E3
MQDLCGISADELARLKNPDPIEIGTEPVSQPARDDAKPRMHYPDEMYAFLMGSSDADMWNRTSEATPPVPLSE